VKWAAPAGGGGGFTQIAQTTVSSPVASISFGSLGSYTNLLIAVSDCVTADAAGSEDLVIQFNSDTTISHYPTSEIYYNSPGSGSGNATGAGTTGTVGGCSGANAATSYLGDSGQITINGYRNTTASHPKFLTWNYALNFGTSGTNIATASGSMIWLTTGSAITSISLVSKSASNFTAGTFTLYGLQ
jgi:hypothetical protein